MRRDRCTKQGDLMVLGDGGRLGVHGRIYVHILGKPTPIEGYVCFFP